MGMRYSTFDLQKQSLIPGPGQYEIKKSLLEDAPKVKFGTG